MKRILFILFLIGLKVSNAQYSALFDANSFIDSVSSPGIKKYGLKFSFTGYPNPVQFVVKNPDNGLFFHGDSIPDLIRDTSQIPVYPFNCYAIDLLNYPDTVGRCKVVPNQKCIKFNGFTSNTPLTCDGHLNFTIDTAGRKFPADYQFCHLTYFPNTTQISGLNLLTTGIKNFDTLCPGYYYIVAFVETFGVSGTMWYYEQYPFAINWPYSPSYTSQVNVNPFVTTSADTCLGKAYVNMIGGTPPFSYSYDGGPFSNSDSITNLCSGFHTVNVTDFAGVNSSGYFIINVDSTIYNNPIPTSQVVDTIICNFSNCNFNYNLPVDSAYLINYSVIDTNTIFFEWEIWQLGTSVIVSDTISYLYQPGTNMISLIMFCGNAKMQVNSKFKTFRANDFAELNVWSALSVKQSNKPSNLYFYPNPFNDELFVDIKNREINFKGLWNSLGQKLEIENSNDGEKIKLNTKNLPKGIYFISIQEKNHTPDIKKIIK